MFDSAVVEVAIGIALMYLVLSLFCTAVQEWIAQLIGWRARHLEATVKYLFDDSLPRQTLPTALPPADADPGAGPVATSAELAQTVLEHPLVRMLTTARRELMSSTTKKPAYIPGRNFALALLDTLGPDRDPITKEITFAGLRRSLDKLAVGGQLANSSLHDALRPILDTAEQDVGKAIVGIEEWYDSAMDRASGWYKRQVRWVLLALGLLLGVLTNADTVQVAMHLAEDGETRTKVATLAAATAGPDAEADAAIKTLSAKLNAEWRAGDVLAGFGDLPVGWAVCHRPGPASGGFSIANCYPGSVGGAAAVFYKIFGLLLTALAVSLGAPFWFGLLQQFNAARSAGPRPATASTRTAAQP